MEPSAFQAGVFGYWDPATLCHVFPDTPATAVPGSPVTRMIFVLNTGSVVYVPAGFEPS
jgi:hypothetical protein